MMIKINPREKLLIAAGLIVLFLLFYYLFAVQTAFSQRKKIVKGIEAKKTSILKMQEFKKELEETENSQMGARNLLNHRPQDFTLLSFLERASSEFNIQDKIRYMKPLQADEVQPGTARLEGIEIEIEGLNIKDLVNFLYRIEYSENLLSIKRIKIQRSSKTQLLKVTLQVNTYISGV